MKAIFIEKVAIIATYFFDYIGGFHMNKEPMETTILQEIKRRKRKVSSDYVVSRVYSQEVVFSFSVYGASRQRDGTKWN